MNTATSVPHPNPLPPGSPSAARLLVMVATRKGAWLYQAGPDRQRRTVDGPHFLTHTICQLRLDPRDGRTLLAAAKTKTGVRSSKTGVRSSI